MQAEEVSMAEARKRREGIRERSLAAPEEVLQAIEQLAAQHERSVNREMILALKAWIKQHETEEER